MDTGLAPPLIAGSVPVHHPTDATRNQDIFLTPGDDVLLIQNVQRVRVRRVLEDAPPLLIARMVRLRGLDAPYQSTNPKQAVALCDV